MFLFFSNSVNTTTIEVASFNALFTNINKPVSRDYEDIIERDYNSALIPVDFDDVNNTFTKINEDIRVATRGLIPYTVTPQDFLDANILMVSSLYFKGKWKVSLWKMGIRKKTVIIYQNN